MRTYTGQLTTLPPKSIFVFGSNTQGRHGLGSALTAMLCFGAKYGQAQGLQGQSYAIITKDLTSKTQPSRTKEQIIKQIGMLYDFANRFDDWLFYVAYSATGKNLNYYTAQQMAEMFGSFVQIPENIVFEQEFAQLIEEYRKTQL